MMLLVAIITTVLDQLTKQLALARFTTAVDGAVMNTGDHITVIPGFFDLRLVMNHGAAWGMLSGQRFILIGVSAAMLVFIVLNRKELSKGRRDTIFALGLLAGGIIGNLIDRIRTGAVVDFFDFHWKEAYNFPVFNIADTAICIGIGALLIVSAFHRRENTSATTPSSLRDAPGGAPRTSPGNGSPVAPGMTTTPSSLRDATGGAPRTSPGKGSPVAPGMTTTPSSLRDAPGGAPRTSPGKGSPVAPGMTTTPSSLRDATPSPAKGSPRIAGTTGIPFAGEGVDGEAGRGSGNS